MQSVKDRYSRYDEIFTRTSSSMVFVPQILEEIVRRIKGRWLDIGSGDGYKIGAISRGVARDRVRELVATEPSNLIGRLREEVKGLPFPATVRDASIEELPALEAYDTITMFEVLEHLENQEAIMRKVSKMLDPKGVFICSTPNKWVYRISEKLAGKCTDPTHVSELEPREFKRLMGGFFGSVRYRGFVPAMFLFRRYRRMTAINDLFTSIYTSRTMYCFAEKPAR